jgi:EpsI family protein
VGSTGGAGPAGTRPAALAGAAGAVIAVLLLPHAALWALERAEQGAAAPVLALPAVPGWRSTALATERPAAVPGAVVDATRFVPVFENPSLVQRRLYAGSDGEVGLYVAYYRGQRDDRKLVSSVNALVRSQNPEWNTVRGGSTAAPAGSATVPVRTAEILGAQSGGSRRAQLTVWRVYWIDGRWVASDIRAKVHGAFARLLGRGDEGAAVVLWTDDDDRARAQARLQAFAREALPALDGALEATRAQR